MTAETRSLHRKLAQVMYEAERIPKRGKAPAVMGGYPFVQVGDAADFIRKALAEKVITMMPTKVTVTGQVDRPTAKGGTMTTVDLVVEWTLTDGESGESITIESFGAGADGGDKYSGKASTSAMKYALLSGFLLSTGEDSEASSTPETVSPRGSGFVSDTPHGDTTHDGGLIGTAEAGKTRDSDFEVRKSGDDDHFALGFKLKSNGGGFKVLTRDELALQLADAKDKVVGQRVTVFGTIKDEEYTPKGRTKPIVYQVIQATRIQTPIGLLPRASEAPKQNPSGIGGHEEWDPTPPLPYSEDELVDPPVVPGQESFDLAAVDAEELAMRGQAE